MRKAVIVAGLVALVAVPFVASATVVPAAMNTMLLEGADTSPAPLPVKKHFDFLPVGAGALAIAGVVTGVAVSNSGNSGNSPS